MKREHAEAIARAAKQYAKAIADSEKASEVRAALGPHATRARITSANAKWSRAAEHRDRCYQALVNAIDAADCWPDVKESLTTCKHPLQVGAA